MLLTAAVKAADECVPDDTEAEIQFQAEPVLIVQTDPLLRMEYAFRAFG